MSASLTMTMDGNSSGLVPKPEERSLKEQEYLSIKHALPKTRISHAILHENTSQDRHLSMKLGAITHRQNKLSNTFDQNKRNFIETQLRKSRKWKSQDEMGAATMNFPILRAEVSRRPSMVVLYQSPNYYEKEEESIKQAGVIDGKLLPYMAIRRERTEILQHQGVTYTTKLPTVIELQPRKLQRYNTYCGIDANMHRFGVPVRDERFTRVLSTLAPRRVDDLRFGAARHFNADSDDDGEDFSGYATDDDVVPYSSFGGARTGGDGGSRYNRGKPPVVFPTIAKQRADGTKGGETAGTVEGGGRNQDDTSTDRRFRSPTLRKSFAVKSGRAR